MQQIIKLSKETKLQEQGVPFDLSIILPTICSLDRWIKGNTLMVHNHFGSVWMSIHFYKRPKSLFREQRRQQQKVSNDNRHSFGMLLSSCSTWYVCVHSCTPAVCPAEQRCNWTCDLWWTHCRRKLYLHPYLHIWDYSCSEFSGMCNYSHWCGFRGLVL